MNVFDLYANYYDLLYSDKNYEEEATYIARRVRQHFPTARRVLDMGCGTGAHATRLVQMGFDVLGVDMSESMLAGASRRVNALPERMQPRLRFAHGDARSFNAGESFDAVVSLFHVLSYQRSNADLLGVITSAAAHLEPGSIFLFDFWYGPAVLSQRPETRAKELEDERIRVMRIARSTLLENENLVEVNYTVLIEDKSGHRVERIQETHVMRYLFLPEIDALLERAGMRKLSAEGWLTDEAPGMHTWSAFVVAQKTAP